MVLGGLTPKSGFVVVVVVALFVECPIHTYWSVLFDYLTSTNVHSSTLYAPPFLSSGQTPWLNGKHVVFGKVTDGLDVVKKIEIKGSDMGRPRAQVQIKDCGVVE